MHNKEIDIVLEEVKSTKCGLTKEEAQTRLESNGKNELAQKKKTPMIIKFLGQFKDVMILVLLAAAIVSAIIAIVQETYSDLIDSGIILGIVILNAIIGLVQENKAESALESLKNMNKSYSKVIRSGELINIKSEEVVVGDLVVLEAGDVVPADIRLTKSASLKIEESALTGEAVPVEKDASKICDEKSPLADRVNMAYSNTIVSYGRGEGIVVATAMDTEVGKIAKMLDSGKPEVTPLQKELAKTAKYLSIIVLGIALIIFIVAIIRKMEMLRAFMTAVAIAVAAIPEGLPAVVTIVLSIGVTKMSKRNAIVKNLPAVETLGSCEIICSDKTGTLTLNQMTVKKLYANEKLIDFDGYDESFELLTKSMMLCNDTIKKEGGYNGDPTETALVKYGEEHNIDYELLKKDNERIDEIPFDSVRKLMSTVNVNNGVKKAYIKGAPDNILNICKYILINGEKREITDADKEEIKRVNYSMMDKALRVLGIANKDSDLELETLENNLTFIGLVGMIDPPREEVREAVRVCKAAGMKPIMITGDHIHTASVIAKDIGIMEENDKAMLGVDIDKYSMDEFKQIIREYAVFARVSPENKVKIVEAYQSFGCVVAMTGDGVNDAPSIKEANIGVGMGITGTDVSKGAADIILTDDNFATIIASVEEGRKIYSNITKAIKFLLSANLAEVICAFICIVFLGVEFLTPVMILWVNLITDSFPALSLGVEMAEGNVMSEPPRKKRKSLFSGRLGYQILIEGLLQTSLVLFAFLLSKYVLAVDKASTMAFVVLCLVQLFHSFNAKFEIGSLFSKKMFKNLFLNLSFVLGVGLIALVMFVPGIRNIFGLIKLDGIEWLIAIGLSFAIIPLVEIEKFIIRKIMKKK